MDAADIRMPLHRFAGTFRRHKNRDDRAHGRLQNPLAQNDVRAGEPSRRWEARWNKWKGQSFEDAAQLRNSLRRSRRQKTAIKSLSRENARLRKTAKTSRGRIETLEAQLARLRATGAVLSKALFGRKSEQQEKPRSEHPRGQQPGGAGHGRTQRPGREERTEELNPPEDARVCSCCGHPGLSAWPCHWQRVVSAMPTHQDYLRFAIWLGRFGCGYGLALAYLARVLGTEGDIDSRLTSALRGMR